MTITPYRSLGGLPGNMDYNEQTRWKEIGQITVAQALLGPTAKDHASVIALPDGAGVVHIVPDGSIAWEYRFRTDGSEDDAPIIEMYRCAGIDHFSHVAQLTLAQGTQQDGSGNFFADSITAANEAWFDSSFSVQPSAPDNNIAGYGLNVFGNNQFLFIASALVVTTIYIDGRRLP